jgi:hypothetical protein
MYILYFMKYYLNIVKVTNILVELQDYYPSVPLVQPTQPGWLGDFRRRACCIAL